MPKSRAEIQKEYRDRQKAKGSQFLQKERQRTKCYYKPAAELSKRKLSERNKNAKLRNRLSRFRKNERLLQDEAQNSTQTVDSSGYASMEPGTAEPLEPEPGPSTRSTTGPHFQPLIVKLPELKRSANKGSGLKKTKKRALARARKSINNLENDIKSLRRKLKTRSKQVERLKARVNKGTESDLTPRKQTDKDISELSLTPRRKRIVRRKLLLGNAVLREIRETKNYTTRKSRKLLHSVVSGQVTKKYRLLSEISKSTGLSRNSLRKCRFKKLEKIIEKRKSLIKAIQNNVHAFLQREDNCRMQPGKADAKRDEKGEKQQTVVLTDYMSNLHLKFSSENPEIKVSLASFCRMRPKHVLLASFISRNTCQCIRHQNMALKIQSLRKLGVNLNRNPENILTEMDKLDGILSELPDDVPFKVWKKVPLENGVQKMKIVEDSREKIAFSVMFQTDVAEFSEHVERVKQQYHELRTLKENLPEHEMILHMDFAENFSCRSLDEVQTAYWNQTSVTLHPVVIYFNEGDTLKHKSTVILSDETHHSAATVCAFLDAFVPKLREIDQNVRKIHYWTDSPSSQYRNRFIFHTVAKHEDTFGMKANWNYFEAGHGKGPCDGLGGTTKRMADAAVRQGKTEIQDANDFYKWAVSSSMKEVSFLFVSKDTCERKKAELNGIPVKPVKDTMKLHAIVGVSSSSILTRQTSCYCELCIASNYCNTWTDAPIEMKANRVRANRNQQQTEQQPMTVTENETHLENEEVQTNALRDPTENPTEDVASTKDNYEVTDFNTNMFVACIYNKCWFIGQITEVDDDEKEIEINFMEKSKNLYRWPARKDEIWIPFRDVLCEIAKPKPSGKSQRNFLLAKEDHSKIEDKFDAKN